MECLLNETTDSLVPAQSAFETSPEGLEEALPG